MKKRILSLLLCLVMIFTLLPTFTLPVRAAEGDSRNVSNTSMNTFETLKFSTSTSELTKAVNSDKSPTGPGSFAIRTISELLVSGKGTWNESKAPGLYDYGAATPGMNFRSKTDDYMYNLISRTSADAYTKNTLPTDYTFVKTLAFDPTGSGKDDFVAYLYGTNHFINDSSISSRASYTLYVASKDGIISSVYNLGTTPFVLLTHQADAYMPLAAGDYDGDGCDELAVYCFGDNTAPKQWGSTSTPYYQTDTDGNLVDNKNRRIDTNGYLIATLADGTTWCRIANESTVETTYYLDNETHLINSDGAHINASGVALEASDALVPGTPVLGEAVGYEQTASDDENLDVRVLNVDVATTAGPDNTVAVNGIALSRATRSAAGGGTIDVEYDLTNLGFSKAGVREIETQELANKKLYPIVDISTVEQPGDQYDDLVLCVSRANYSVKTAAEAATRMVFWIDSGSATGAKTQTAAGVWNQVDAYGTGSDSRAEMMAFGGASQANLDGDADGSNEVVVAGYRYYNTDLNVRLSSLTDGPSGDDNPFKMDQENDNIDHYLAATYSYNAAAKTYVSDGPATWIDVDDDDYNDSTNLRENIYDGNNLYDTVFAPLEVLGFAEKGAGCADSVFVNGFVCDYYLSSSGGGVSTLPYGPGSLKSGAFSKRNGNFLFVSYAIPTNYVLVEGKTSRDGKTTTWQRWIGDAVAGNFDGDANGVEELYCTYLRNRDEHGYSKTSATLIAVQKKLPGTLSNTSDLYNGDLMINEDSSIYDEQDTVGSQNYSFSANDLWEAENGYNLALSAPDWDDDAVIARPSAEKAPEYYFSDPSVIAVLQSAPYFEELSADYDYYPSNGSTAIEKETGYTHSGSAGFEVSAGVIIGVKAEIKPFGIPIGEAETKTTVSANFSMEYSHESTKNYSTAFTAMVGTDMVALTMTPYVRYYYDVYNPETREWATAEMTVDMPETPRTSMVSVETYDRVAAYSGWESIRGNILNSTPGDPYSYATTDSGLSGFEGGKTTMGDSGNDWVGVGTGGTSAVGNITQTISSETTDGFNISIGASVEREDTVTVFGATAGFTSSFGVTAGYGYATFTGMSFSGTVDNLPEDAAAGYNFLWRFGCWKDSLSYTTSSGKTDSSSVYVLGYLVKDTKSLPKPPQDLSVVDFTENSITLEWSHPNVVPVSYIIYREEAGGLVPLEIVRANKTNATQQYIDTTCEPGTTYNYVIASVRYVNGFETKGPNSPTATGTTLSSGAPQVSIEPLRHKVQSGDSVIFTATVTPVPGGSAPTLQWQKWNGVRYVDLSGASRDTYTLSNVTDEMSGSRYRCYATQLVNGRHKTGYSRYAELTVTKRASITALANIDTSYAMNDTVALSATVTDKTTPITDGSVVFSIVNTSTGGVWNLKSSLGADGTATNSFTPTAEGVYTVTARYLGTTVYSGSESTEQPFTVYSESGQVLVIESKSKMTYGDTLPLAAKLVGTNGTETAATTATYQVTDEPVFDELTTSVATNNPFNPIAASNSLFRARNKQQRGYNDACGNYIIRATYTADGKTYYATKLVTVKPKTLKITVGNKTVSNFSSTPLDANYLSDVTVSYDGFINYNDNGDTVKNYEALFELYTDTAYGNLFVGDHAIKLRYKDAAASGLTNYETVVAQLLANYNVVYQAGTLFITDNWYEVTYAVAAGAGSLDARTENRAVLPSDTEVLAGTDLTFAAAPAAGYEVTNWSVTGSDLSSRSRAAAVPTTQSGSITGDTNVLVTFSAGTPTLSWSVSGGNGKLNGTVGTTGISSPATVSSQGVYTLTAVPDAGYMVNQWTVNGEVKKNANGGVDRSAALSLRSLTQDTVVTTSFAPIQSYTVKAAGMSETGGSLGSVTISPAPADGKLTAGTAVAFTAGAPTDFFIREWRSYSADGSYTVLQYNVPTYTIASLAANADIRVVFAPMVKYTLNFGVGRGSGRITAASGAVQLTSGESYEANIPLRFTVTPNDGYRVDTLAVQYSDGTSDTLSPVSVSGSARIYTLTLSKAVTVTANFVDKGSAYNVTVTNGTGGGKYYEGDLVSIIADPAPAGKAFSGWTSADGVSFASASAAATTFFMPGKDVTVNANYAASETDGQTFTLYFKTNGGSKLDPVTAPRDTVISLSSYRTTRAGYLFDGWYLDAKLTRPVTRVTLTEDTTVYAGWTEGSSEGLLNTEDHIAYLAGYASGEFGPNRNITRAETAMLFYRLLSDPAAGGRSFFPDVEAGAWYAEAVEKLAGLGIIAGYADGTFRPGNSITRAEFVAMATRFVTLTGADCSFTDVSRSHWAYGYIAFASSQGWISGYADGSFRPGSFITRAEVTKIVNRMLGRTSDRAYIDSHPVRTFSDVPKTHWAYYEIAEATNAHDYQENANGTESWTRIK